MCPMNSVEKGKGEGRGEVEVAWQNQMWEESRQNSIDKKGRNRGLVPVNEKVLDSFFFLLHCMREGVPKKKL